MSTHVLKLHAEEPGTVYTYENGETIISRSGHLWLEVIYPNGEAFELGFGPTDPKSELSSVPGKVFTNDSTAYAGAPAFTATFEITADQASTLGQFGES